MHHEANDFYLRGERTSGKSHVKNSMKGTAGVHQQETLQTFIHSFSNVLPNMQNIHSPVLALKGEKERM